MVDLYYRTIDYTGRSLAGGPNKSEITIKTKDTKIKLQETELVILKTINYSPLTIWKLNENMFSEFA